jgi:type I restriction enzyme M protein
MARTSKMNMIMHGDGHGGVHHHDGFINVNGIFEGRFDIILTNPPFGANVEESDIILESDVATDEEDERRYIREFGKLYSEAQAKVRAAKGKPIASLFELPKDSNGRVRKIKTEILFIERCLSLLKPGGRMGIVLPEGVFNNPSLVYVREFCENRAYVRAVVSLPPETFISSGASVKASLLFLQRFGEKEQADFNAKQKEAEAEVEAKYASETASETTRLKTQIEEAKKTPDSDKLKAVQKELAGYLKKMEEKSRSACTFKRTLFIPGFPL